MATLYHPLDVIETSSKIDGMRWFVRDEEESHLWNLVEYLGHPGRLTCECPDGEAHDDSPDTEPECAHLRAVIDQRAADQAAKGPKLGVLKPSIFCD